MTRTTSLSCRSGDQEARRQQCVLVQPVGHRRPFCRPRRAGKRQSNPFWRQGGRRQTSRKAQPRHISSFPLVFWHVPTKMAINVQCANTHRPGGDQRIRTAPGQLLRRLSCMWIASILWMFKWRGKTSQSWCGKSKCSRAVEGCKVRSGKYHSALDAASQKAHNV